MNLLRRFNRLAWLRETRSDTPVWASLIEFRYVFSEARGHPGRSSFNHFQRVGSFLNLMANRCCCGLEGRAPLDTYNVRDAHGRASLMLDWRLA